MRGVHVAAVWLWQLPSNALRRGGAGATCLLLQLRIEHARALDRIINVAGDLVHERFQRMGAAHIEPAAVVRVAVEIGDGIGIQRDAVLLRPLGGAEQAPLLAIPSGEDDRPRRPPAGPEQRT